MFGGLRATINPTASTPSASVSPRVVAGELVGSCRLVVTGRNSRSEVQDFISPIDAPTRRKTEAKKNKR